MFENIDLGTILEEKTGELVKDLLNFIEQLSSSLCEARGRVRKRDISFGPRTEQGKQAWDTFTTLAATLHLHRAADAVQVKKLKVSV